MKQHIAITESEWHVMKIIWNDPPKTLQDILSNLKHTDWSTTTIQTYLARLVKKYRICVDEQMNHIYHCIANTNL